MTDYLEPREGENEDALWEAVRRLNALFRNTGEEETASEEESAEGAQERETKETARRENAGAEGRAEDAGAAAPREIPEAVDRAKYPEEAVLAEIPEIVDRAGDPGTTSLTETPEAAGRAGGTGTPPLTETLETADRAGSMETADQTRKGTAMAREKAEARESAPLPLLDEVEALDRALEGRELLDRTRTWAGEAGPEAGMGRNAVRTGPDGFRRERGTWTEPLWNRREAEGLPSGGSTSVWTDGDLQAERLDRVFRRDSRRYDGGFFLY